jgi:hypothetical protein
LTHGITGYWNNGVTGVHNPKNTKGRGMPPFDPSPVTSIRDPELRAQLERLGRRIDALPWPEPEPAPSSAKVIQLPLFPRETRPISNDMARSALFSCIQGKDRRYIEDALLASQDGAEIRFTGKQLNQDDHDLLMTLVFMAQHKPLGA